MSKPIRFWIVRYSHKHGNDLWPDFSNEEPHEEDIIEDLRESGEWDEGDDIRHRQGMDTFIEVTGSFEVPGGARYPRDWHPTGEWKEGLPTEEGRWWLYTQDLKHPDLSRVRLAKAALSGSNTMMVSADGAFIHTSEWAKVNFFHMPAVLPEPPITENG